MGRLHAPMQYPQRPEDGIRSPGAGVTGSCKLPGVGARNRILVLCKSSMYF